MRPARLPAPYDASRRRGLGPECKNRAAVDEVMGILEEERAKMRTWLKQNRSK